MRTRFLSSILKISFGMSLLALPAIAKMTKEAKASEPVLEKVSPAKDFIKSELDKKISQMVENLKSAKGNALFKELSRMIADLKALRKDSPRQSEEDEIYIETVLLVIQEIPRPPKFKKEKCSEYRNSILASYDPHHETSPSTSVSKGLEVLDLFCR